MYSTTIAACAALLIAGSTTQASADGTGERPERPVRGIAGYQGHENIRVTGKNNNVAGNDLIIGDNNTSGTGHAIGPATQLTPFTNCINIQNASDTPFTNGQAEFLNTAKGAITRPLPTTLAPNETAVVCAKSVDLLLGLWASYDIKSANVDTNVAFNMTNLGPSEPSYSIQQPASPYSAGLITRTTDGSYFNSTSFLVDCPGPGGCTP
ncbi:hypothetical protein GCM10022295_90290 [Streptomyces osmaniensis]|uniref:Secreted protein n=1 Tax=Streptomyces osmaniensis TaxID=593134 RepID=A0ABP6Z578_9ACTN|nr:hypothetical protein KJK32_46280 [Streptomyces sp. JCM17656]